MPLNKFLLISITFILFFSNCSTKLVKTETDYRAISPPKSRLISNFKILSDISPIISVQLKEEILSEKVKTYHYTRRYSWFNRTFWLGLTSLTLGWAFTVDDWSIEYSPQDSFYDFGNSIYIACLSALPFFATFLYPDFPLSPKYWKKQQVLKYDTSYQFQSVLVYKQIRVSSPFEEKLLSTDAQGNLPIDVREFYNPSLAESDLIIQLSYENLTNEIKIPASYIKNIKEYENEALEIYERAQLEESNNRLEDALSLYDSIINRYTNAKVKYEASQKITLIRNKISQQKITEIRKKLSAVSDEKVRNIIAILIPAYESDAFGRRIDNLPSSYAKSVVKDGLGMPLSDNECLQEYNNLNIYQKFYAVLCYKDYLINSGMDKMEIINKLSDMLYLNYETAQKIIEIDPQRVMAK